MREPRPGIAWSKRRVTRRAAYAAWMASAAWQDRRRQWLETWLAGHGRPPVCAACGGPWSLHTGDLHHRSYARLGHETDRDLIPLDRDCHDQVHKILESTPAWTRLGRSYSTDLVVARLRQTNSASRRAGDTTRTSESAHTDSSRFERPR